MFAGTIRDIFMSTGDGHPRPGPDHAGGRGLAHAGAVARDQGRSEGIVKRVLVCFYLRQSLVSMLAKEAPYRDGPKKVNKNGVRIL